MIVKQGAPRALLVTEIYEKATNAVTANLPVASVWNEVLLVLFCPPCCAALDADVEIRPPTLACSGRTRGSG